MFFSFIHQHNSQDRIDGGIFYSKDSYQRNDYKYYWQINQQICSNTQENNLDTVKHVRIGGKQTINNYVHYFPNTTKLAIENYFKISGDSIAIILNRIIPLEQLIELLRFTSNLHTIKYYAALFNKTNLKLIKKMIFFNMYQLEIKLKNWKFLMNGVH
ncbi:unnamed protein product [Rotaria sp. Silwood1]|nr:unnamed protein product [Rotaria sp. Silwood1]CAF1311564.1 unnamed protein product [Rotaria sp. Silwood1]